MEETLLTAISTVGFPIVVTFYLLTRFQKSMDNMTAQLAELVKVLQQYVSIHAPHTRSDSHTFTPSFF